MVSKQLKCTYISVLQIQTALYSPWSTMRSTTRSTIFTITSDWTGANTHWLTYMHAVMEGRMEGKRWRGRRRLFDDWWDDGKGENVKRTDEDRTRWIRRRKQPMDVTTMSISRYHIADYRKKKTHQTMVGAGRPLPVQVITVPTVSSSPSVMFGPIEISLTPSAVERRHSYNTNTNAPFLVRRLHQ